MTEPVAGTSGGKTQLTSVETTKTDNQTDEAAMTEAGGAKRGQRGDKQESTGLSKAQINVVKTMVYITVCFTLCWMPMYIATLITLLVSQLYTKYKN